MTNTINYKECDPVLGFNTKQWFIYANDQDVFVDPPITVLEDLKKYSYPDGQEDRLYEIIATNPKWLQDKDFWYGGNIEI